MKPKEIEVVKEKATYKLPVYKVTANGLEEAGTMDLKFVKGNRADEKVFRQEGIMTETLIGAAIKYLEENNVGDLENEYSTNAIAHLKTALNKLEARVRDREQRNVSGTYQK